MRQYHENLYWSIALGGDVARLSMADDQGREYFAIVSAEQPGYRDRRMGALEALMEAIDRGDDPGQVEI